MALPCLALPCLVLYCIVLYCIVLYCIVLYCIVLYCIVLYCIVLYCTVLYCILICCIALNCCPPTRNNLTLDTTLAIVIINLIPRLSLSDQLPSLVPRYGFAPGSHRSTEYGSAGQMIHFPVSSVILSESSWLTGSNLAFSSLPPPRWLGGGTSVSTAGGPWIAPCFRRSSHPSDLKIGTLVGTLLHAWRFRVTARYGVSIL